MKITGFTKIISVLLLCATISGCATSVQWRNLTIGLSLADVGTTSVATRSGKCQEINPLVGNKNVAVRTFALHAVIIGIVYWMTDKDDEYSKIKIWRTAAIIRGAYVGWNLSQLHRCQ